MILNLINMYELTYIIKPELSETEISAAVKKMADLIAKQNGSIISEKIDQKRRLAYPIKKAGFGTYVSVEFDSPGEGIIVISQAIKMDNTILRHLIIKKEIAKGPLPILKAKPKKTAFKKSTYKSIAEKKPASKETTAPSKKIKLEELDEKLEEILKD